MRERTRWIKGPVRYGTEGFGYPRGTVRLGETYSKCSGQLSSLSCSSQIQGCKCTDTDWSPVWQHEYLQARLQRRTSNPSYAERKDPAYSEDDRHGDMRHFQGAQRMKLLSYTVM